MHVMKRIFTYLLAIGLFLACVFSEELAPQNISYGLMSSVKRNALKDRQELFEDMKAVVQNGVIKIEVYTDEGELIETLEKPEDFTSDMELVFTKEDLKIKTVSKAPMVILP